MSARMSPIRGQAGSFYSIRVPRIFDPSRTYRSLRAACERCAAVLRSWLLTQMSRQWRGPRGDRMAREQPLEPAVVRTWLAMWEQRDDPFCDDAVRHLQTLIPDNNCYVVITLGTGREPRSLVFRRWRHVIPLARNIAELIAEQKRSCWNTTSIKCPSARRHQWLEMPANFGTRLALARGRRKSSNGTVWIGCSMVMSATIRSYQSRESRTVGSWKRSPLLTSLQGGTNAPKSFTRSTTRPGGMRSCFSTV